MINQISLAGGTRRPTNSNYRGSLAEVPAQTLGRMPNHIAEHDAGNLEQERTFRLFEGEGNARNQVAASIPRDRPGFEETYGPDPSPREIRLRAAKIRAGWTDRERQIRLANRTRRIALQFERFVRLIGQQTTGEGRN
jgi:hypothetical protein